MGSKGAFTNECKAEYAKNPSNVKYIFPAQRTHIATLLKADDYAVTQYSSFGTDTNFSYPYKILDSADKNSTGIRTGFAYDGAFKNFMVYTHHLADPSHDFPFLSCGIIRIIPKSNDSNKFQMVGNYMANTFGSRYMASEVSKDGKTFRKLSATVPTIDIDGQEMADMEVLAFGFDNGSDSLSDYWTFHYAAEVMKDPSLSVQNGALIDNKKSGTDGSIITYFKKFRQMLEDKTCFTLVHTGNTII